MHFCFRMILLAGLVSSTAGDCSPAWGEETSSEEDATNPGRFGEPQFYLGRQIAPTMHFSGAAWLTRPERDREENTEKMIAALRMAAGDTVCDLGCGNGYHTLRLSRLVGPRGRVLGVDIQSEMLEMLSQRAESRGIANITPIQGTPQDPKLPENSLDLVLLVDVYHEFSHPQEMLAKIHISLKPTGRVVLVEFRAEDPDVPIRPLHKMSRKQVVKELQANDFRLVRSYNALPWQHMLFFEPLSPQPPSP